MIDPPIDERYEQAAVKQSLTTGERTAAEETYTRRAFDYEQNPIGSRDWTLFWSGWCARAVQSLATIQNSHQPAAQVAQAVADGFAPLPAEATDEMQDNMRQALIDQGWDSDSAGEVDFADIWHAGVYEYLEREADMLAARQKDGGAE